MNSIFIKLLKKNTTLIWEIPCLQATITLGDFTEGIEIPIKYWSIEDYKKQWKEGLERIKTHNNSLLITYVQDPHKRPFVKWWPLYKRNNKIYVQNRMLFSTNYKKVIGQETLTVENWQKFIPTKRYTKSGDAKISEWSVDANFLK